jgi:GH15 family glucan-1,4-alpha-glucosidase
MNGIGDYAMIGDCHSMALVGPDGSIDWCCFPRFDSPSVFASVLDRDRGGYFRVMPGENVRKVERMYLPATNVLETTFDTDSGRLELTDCMPVGRFDPARPAAVESRHSLLRRVRCIEGRASAEITIEPRYEYGRVTPRFTMTSSTAAAVVGGSDALWVRATKALQCDGDRLSAVWPLEAGQEEWIEVAWTPAAEANPLRISRPRRAMTSRLADTIAFWQQWFAGCTYDGEHHRKVHRSALILKALTYAPTGAVVAAGTTALPDWIGGERNCDYRFTWIRDSTVTLTSLLILGYLPEARAFKTWLERTGAGRPQDLQIMYRVTGERLLPEVTLSHLAGYRGSGPVRVGNAAAEQRQLDTYGQLLEAASLFAMAGGEFTSANAAFLSRVADLAAESWRLPDQGLWEIRDNPRHFVHSKLFCWIALDCACRLVHNGVLDRSDQEWRRNRDLLADWLLSEGSPDGWFVQAAGRSVADASTLLVPAVGFLPVAHPKVVRTIEVVQRDLANGALLHRYLDPDGLTGPEGAFQLCSFWLADCLIAAGRLDEADELLDTLLGLSNDVGIFSEMVDPATGEPLGNTPQAYSHMAVVTTCEGLTAARRGLLPPPTDAYSFREAAVLRRFAPSS